MQGAIHMKAGWVLLKEGTGYMGYAFWRPVNNLCWETRSLIKTSLWAVNKIFVAEGIHSEDEKKRSFLSNVILKFEHKGTERMENKWSGPSSMSAKEIYDIL